MKTRTLTLLLGLAAWALPAAAEPPRVLYDDVSNQHFPKSLPSTSSTSSGSDTGQDTSGNNNNRSGLGDGTNPGQGAEHNAGNNSGTLNPGGLKKK